MHLAASEGVLALLQLPLEVRADAVNSSGLKGSRSLWSIQFRTEKQESRPEGVRRLRHPA
ncbi:MAG: hypothetical protein AUG47_04680 [Alphaproteobacteria bacterium 13_1_20CM_3_64_12]|nr:MAG: hypothetical protein AUG47_04680 [Alphaproteobacteria bacterium 13_1_20CM_3_64_12]